MVSINTIGRALITVFGSEIIMSVLSAMIGNIKRWWITYLPTPAIGKKIMKTKQILIIRKFIG